MRTRYLSAAIFTLSFFVLSSVLSVPVFAVNQPASLSFIETDIITGASSELLLPFFSEHTFDTTLEISAEGEGFEYISIDPVVRLPAGEVVYSRMKIDIPDDYSGPKEIRPTVKVVETTEYQGSEFNLDEIKNEVRINIIDLASVEDPTESFEEITSHDETALDESEIIEQSTTETTEITTTQTTTDSQEVTTATESEETTTAQTTTTDSEDVAVDGTQDESTAIVESTTDTDDTQGSDTVEDRGLQENTGESGDEEIEGTQTVTTTSTGALEDRTEDRRERIEKVQERLERVFKKVADKIEERRERIKSEKISESDVHDFDFIKSDLEKIGIDLNKNITEIEVVVNTLSISKVEVKETEAGETVEEVVQEETTSSGVVTTSSQIVPVESVSEEERDIVIDVGGGVTLPDIEQRIVKEEIIGETPKGEVVRKVTKKKAYKYIEIEVEGAESSDIEKTTIDFEVEKSWLADNNIDDPSLVRLNRFTDDWVELPTTLVDEDANSYKYSADSEGFSFFVITAAITADITTPISIEVPEVQEQVAEDEDYVGDLLGTTKPQPLLIINISWLLAVVAIGIVILVKYNAIKSALSKMHVKEDTIKRLEREKKRYETMKEKTTKRFYKRAIAEDEFKSLIKDYDKNIIRLDTEIEDLKGGK